MTPSLLGLNYSIDHTADVIKRDTFHDALAPAYSVAMVDAPKDAFRIKDTAVAHPDTVIVGRIWDRLQGGFHLKPTGKGDEDKEFVASPEDVANQMDETGFRLGIDGKTWAYVLNEPMGNGDPINLDRLGTWYSRWIDRAIGQKRRSVIYNWGDREPEIMPDGMWNARWYGQLRQMAVYPDLFMVGMHLYGPDKMTDHLQAFLKTCDYLRITSLKVLITEFGVDTDAGSATNGYHSRGWTSEQMGQWIESQITGDLSPYIKSGLLAGLCLFTWSNHPEWSAFNISEDTGLQGYLRDAKKRGVLDAPAPKKATLTVPIVKPFPSDFATRSIEKMIRGKNQSQFIRKYPYIAAEHLWPMSTEDIHCDIIPIEKLHPEETVVQTIVGKQGTWLPIKCNAIEGWIWDSEVVITDIVPKAEPTTPIIPMLTLPISVAKALRQSLLDQIAVLDTYIQQEKVSN